MTQLNVCLPPHAWVEGSNVTRLSAFLISVEFPTVSRRIPMMIYLELGGFYKVQQKAGTGRITQMFQAGRLVKAWLLGDIKYMAGLSQSAWYGQMNR